eukprot:EG_transcript_40787
MAREKRVDILIIRWVSPLKATGIRQIKDLAVCACHYISTGFSAAPSVLLRTNAEEKTPTRHFSVFFSAAFRRRRKWTAQCDGRWASELGAAGQTQCRRGPQKQGLERAARLGRRPTGLTSTRPATVTWWCVEARHS